MKKEGKKTKATFSITELDTEFTFEKIILTIISKCLFKNKKIYDSFVSKALVINKELNLFVNIYELYHIVFFKSEKYIDSISLFFQAGKHVKCQ